MKSIFRNVAVFTFGLLVAGTTTSCHRGDDVEASSTISLTTTRTLVVRMSSAVAGATVSYAGKTVTSADGIVYTFENAAQSGNLVIGGTLMSQIIPVNFNDLSTLVIDVNAVKPSSLTKTLAQINSGNPVDNDNDNQNSTGSKARLVAPSGSANAPSGSADFSLTVYSPATVAKKSVSKEEVVNVTPYVVSCKPDGATFTPAATLSLEVEGVNEIGNEALSFKHEGTGDVESTTVSGDVVTASVSHFSDWSLVLSAVCVEKDSTAIELKPGNLAVGKNVIEYEEFFGFESDAVSIVEKWLKCVFGSTKTTVKKVTTIEASSLGTYKIMQKVYNYTFKAGNKTFKASVYGPVYAEVTYEEGGEVPEPVPTHSGGSSL